MTQSWVLMTALPPTSGHGALIDFAASLTDMVNVVLCTQPSEPLVGERFLAIEAHCERIGNARAYHYHKEVPQVPEDDENFWGMWRNILYRAGLHAGDVIVASESYGKKLAEVTGCKFMPYDPYRQTQPGHATDVRHEPLSNFDYLLDEFKPFRQFRVTVFGAESTGKSTLARHLAMRLNNSHYLFEWARPYLEQVRNEINVETMTDIAEGQFALQRAASKLPPRPFIVQDTDLFSTVGYWDYNPGSTPSWLVQNAQATASDFYIVTTSDIPFEPDPLRYGGDKRETSDQYWIDLLERYRLPYLVVSGSLPDRLALAEKVARKLYVDKYTIDYVRRGQ